MPTVPQMPTPQGWLWKRGVTNKKFRRRWFVLTPSGEALYYKSPPTPGSQAMLQGSFACEPGVGGDL